MTTVIIPVYNAAQYVENALDSILHQTHQPEEIIFINDGSTDNSLQIIKGLEAKHPLIKVYSQQNSGPSATRNRGVNYASSEWVCFVDADDLLHPQRLEIASYFSYDCDAVICDYKRFIKPNEVIHPNFEIKNIEVLGDRDSTRSVIQNGFGLPSMLMRKESFLAAGGIDETLVNNEDFELHFRMVTNGVRFRKINCPLYYYRQHNSPTRLTQSPSRVADTYKAIYKMASQIGKLDSNLQKQANEELGNRLANNALKDAIAGNKDYKKHLTFARSLNSNLTPYSKAYLNWLSSIFGFGKLEEFVSNFHSSK